MAQKESFTIGSRNPFAGLDQEDASDVDEALVAKPAPQQPLPVERHPTQQRRKPMPPAAVKGPSDNYTKDRDDTADSYGGSKQQRGPNKRFQDGYRQDENYISDVDVKDRRRNDSKGGFRNSPAAVRGGARVGGVTRHREYDRHVAGTNRNRGMKKEGGGAHNWGNSNPDFGAQMSGDMKKGSTEWDDVADVTRGERDVTAPPNGVAAADVATDTVAVTDDAAADGVAEDNVKAAQEIEVIGFEEYLQQQAAKRANLPLLPTKHVVSPAVQRTELEREGYTLHVKALEPDSRRAVVATTTSPDISTRPLRSREGLNRKYEPEFGAFEMGPRSARGRGRGGGRGGGRGRGDICGRDERPEVRGIKLDFQDSDAFPTLG